MGLSRGLWGLSFRVYVDRIEARIYRGIILPWKCRKHVESKAPIRVVYILLFRNPGGSTF